MQLFQTEMQDFRIFKLSHSLIMQHIALSTKSSHDDDVRRVIATSATKTSETKTYPLSYYAKAGLSGGLCCTVTHGALW